MSAKEKKAETHFQGARTNRNSYTRIVKPRMVISGAALKRLAGTFVCSILRPRRCRGEAKAEWFEDASDFHRGLKET